METPKTDPNAAANPVKYPEFPEHNGLTKRETMFIQFAASAPQEIPAWFEFEKPFKYPTRPADWESMPEDPQRERCKDWHRDPCYDLGPEDAWYQKQFDTYNEARAQVDRDNNAERYFEWRMHYAKIMTDCTVRTLNKPATDEPGA